MDEFSERFPKTRRVIDDGISQGLHIGAQMYVSLRGEIACDAAVGFARPQVPMTTVTLMPWLSAGKPIAAVAISQLRESGRLDWDDPVGRHVPEFATRGKEPVTIRHLLTHTGGFRWADFSAMMDWDSIISRIAAAPLEPRWIPGQSAGYHAYTSWYILAEIVRRADPDHRDFQTYARDEIFLPLGMDDCWVAMSPMKFIEYGPRMGALQATQGAHGSTIRFDTPDRCMFPAPGGSLRGPMRQLGKFYEMMLGQTRGNTSRHILTPASIADLTARQRVGLFDLTFKHIVDWGLGFIVNSAQYGEPTVPYGFGPHASGRTFGHSGNQSSIGFADPEHRLAAALVFNGMPGESAHHQRIRAATAAIYEDLHLA